MKKISTILLALVALFSGLSLQAENKAVTLTAGTARDYQRVEISDQVLFAPAADGRVAKSMTMSAWVRFPETLGYTSGYAAMPILGHRAQHYANDNGSMLLGYTQGGQYRSKAGAGNKELEFNVPVKKGEWTLLTMTYDAESHEFAFYADGEVLGSYDNEKAWSLFQDNNGGTYPLSTIFFIGGANMAVDVDEILLYDRALSAMEVILAQEVGAELDGLVALYDFNEPTEAGVYPNKVEGAASSHSAYVRHVLANTYQWGTYMTSSYTPIATTTVEGREVAGGEDPQPVSKIDVINRAFFGIEENYAKTDYTNYTEEAPSGAQYIAYLTQRKKGATGSAALGMRISNTPKSGIVTDKSGGFVKKISVLLSEKAGTAEMYMEIYGSHTPYDTPSDLFDADKRGDLLGKISHDNDVSAPKELEIAGNYEYFGVKSSYGTFYFQEMKVEWGDGAVAPAEYTMTLAAVENGTLEVFNGETALESGAKVTEGTELTLKATPAEGYEFVTFTLNGEPYAESTYTVGAEDFTLGATFAESAVAPVAGKTDLINQSNLKFASNGSVLKTVECESGATYQVQAYYYSSGQYWQMRSSAYFKEGLVTTVSAGKVKSVGLRFCDIDRSANVQIYGKHSAYTSPEDLTKEDTRGELLGTIAIKLDDIANFQRFNITGDYEYIAIKATASTSVFDAEIEWAGSGAVAPAEYTMTLAAIENGTLEVFNGETALESGAKLAEGTELTLKATPAEGYEFVTFTLNGEAYANDTYTVGAADFTLGATFAEKGYCNPYEGLTVTDKSRYITTLTLDNGQGVSGTIDGMRTAAGGAVYFDKTAAPIAKFKAGETLTVKTTGAGEWMHSYMFVDWNNNKEFEVGDVATTHKAGGEFVTYNRITETDTQLYWYKSDGTRVSEASQPIAGSLPAFVIPEDAASGIYHARYRVAWSVYDPCNTISQVNGNKTLSAQGGQVIDFTFEVEAPVSRTITIKSNDPELGTVSFKGLDIDAASVNSNEDVTVVATPLRETVVFLRWEDTEGNELSAEEEYTYTGDADIELTAVFVEKFVVTLAEPENGSIEVTLDGNTFPSGMRIVAGSELSLKATPDEGYAFVTFLANDEAIEGDTYTLNETVTLSARFEEYVPAYCNPYEGLTNIDKSRYVTTLTMTDSRNNTGTIDGMRTNAGGAIYFDKTETPIGSYYAGESVTVKTTGAGEWMHSYMFVDWNNNLEFEVGDVAETHKAGGELVTYNRITFEDRGGGYGKKGWFDAEGKEYDEETIGVPIAGSLPAFVIPADTKPGIYHARYRVAWSVYDPCSTLSQDKNGKTLSDHGGQVIDFTFEVREYVAPTRTITIKSNNEALGTVAFVDEEVEGNALTTTKGIITVKATVTDADAYFINWTDGDRNVVATSEEYSYSGEEDIELTANFGQHFAVTFDQTVSVRNEFGAIASGTLVEVGTELTAMVLVPTGKVLKAFYANDVDVTDQLVDDEYSFSVTRAMNFRAEFDDMMSTIEITKTGNGTVSVYLVSEDDEDMVEINNGDQVAGGSHLFFILQPAEGEEVESFICNGENWTSELADYITQGGKILALEAYAEQMSVTVAFTNRTGGGGFVDMVAADEAEAEYFTIQGVRVERKNLVPGVYIRRAGDKVEKVLVK